MTDEEIAKCAAVEFEPVAEFIGKPLRPTEEELRGLGVNGRVAMATMRQTKAELVAAVENAPDAMMAGMEELRNAAEYAETLVQICSGAAARINVALATVAAQEVDHAH